MGKEWPRQTSQCLLIIAAITHCTRREPSGKSEEMENDFTLLKFGFFFDFYDYDKNGILEWEDLEKRIRDICISLKEIFEGRGIEATEIESMVERIREGQTITHKVWFEKMCEHAAKERSDVIQRSEWIDFNKSIQKYIHENDAFPAWLEELLKVFFLKGLDANGNGTLDNDGLEFLPGIRESMRDLCFDKITRNGKKEVDCDEFLKLNREYFMVQDPTHYSRYLYGFCE